MSYVAYLPAVRKPKYTQIKQPANLQADLEIGKFKIERNFWRFKKVSLCFNNYGVASSASIDDYSYSSRGLSEFFELTSFKKEDISRNRRISKAFKRFCCWRHIDIINDG